VATSVKMREGDKARLDRLQARLVAKTGQKITQEELLARIVALAESEEDRVAGAPARPKDAEEVWRRLQGLIVRTGKRTRPEDIDRDLHDSGMLG